MAGHVRSGADVAAADLLERFGPLLAEIGAGAVDRERGRVLPVAEVDALREAGFGALRLPVERGGSGASFPALVVLLVELARADSNLVQLLRGHIAFVELVLAPSPSGVPAATQDFWLDQLAAGAVIGNAQSERGGASLLEPATAITRSERGWVIDGRKYYSTGSLVADWIYASGRHGEDHAVALVPTAEPGVERLDDWDGFGQRLTGSGTTVFDAVPLAEEHVQVLDGERWPLVGSQAAVFQLVLLATLAGIGKRALDDAVAFVRGRRRGAFTALTDTPQRDPQVLQVVGELAGLALAAESTVHSAARTLGEVLDAEAAGTAQASDHARAQAVVFAAQGVVVDLVLRLTTDLFRVGGASATAQGLALDRHWRNARTVASHNPEVHRARIVGDHLVNGTEPWAKAGDGR